MENLHGENSSEAQYNIHLQINVRLDNARVENDVNYLRKMS